jgi:Cu+-exporting ATPase
MVRIAFVALAAAAVWLRLSEPMWAISVTGVAGLLIGGWPIFKEAFENLIARRMTMELSMSIAIVAPAAIFEFFTALVITLFVLVAEVLEGMTVSRVAALSETSWTSCRAPSPSAAPAACRRSMPTRWP